MKNEWQTMKHNVTVAEENSFICFLYKLYGTYLSQYTFFDWFLNMDINSTFKQKKKKKKKSQFSYRIKSTHLR